MRLCLTETNEYNEVEMVYDWSKFYVENNAKSRCNVLRSRSYNECTQLQGFTNDVSVSLMGWTNALHCLESIQNIYYEPK